MQFSAKSKPENRLAPSGSMKSRLLNSDYFVLHINLQRYLFGRFIKKYKCLTYKSVSSCEEEMQQTHTYQLLLCDDFIQHLIGNQAVLCQL